MCTSKVMYLTYLHVRLMMIIFIMFKYMYFLEKINKYMNAHLVYIYTSFHLVCLFLSKCNRFALYVLDFPRGSLRRPRPLNSPQLHVNRYGVMIRDYFYCVGMVFTDRAQQLKKTPQLFNLDLDPLYTVSWLSR